MTVSNNVSKASIRDFDIDIVAKIAPVFESCQNDYFVLTGSYSIEALTGGDITHNDVDANIFTNNIAESINNVIDRLRSLDIDGQILQMTKQTDSRLEYAYICGSTTRQLELQFIEFESLSPYGSNIDFIVMRPNGTQAVVPTTLSALKGSTGNVRCLRVKSLAYAIATWALRISGDVSLQKRSIRQTDIDHYRYLLLQKYDENDALKAIAGHPQMPIGADANTIFARSLQVSSC